MNFARVFLYTCLLLLLLSTSNSYADMTIWFQDGTSRQVHKIVFRGEVADLYLIDGRVMNVRVQQLDLKSSGIDSPVGTYGETRLTPGSRIAPSGTAAVAPGGLKQAQLKEEWERSERVATAENQIGSIRQGQKVKIISQPGSTILNPDSDEPVSTDDAYVVIYTNPDGSFSKKVFDASTFAANFKLVQTRAFNSSEPSIGGPPPEFPANPDADISEDSLPITLPPENGVQQESSSETRNQEKIAPVLKSRGTKLIRRDERRFPVFLSGVILVAVIAGIAMLLLKKKRPAVFIDSSRFRQYEEELRDFELELWIKHGKTPEQMTEICVKKYYQDSPEALNIALKMLKTPDRNIIVPLIAKHAPKGPSQADSLYLDMKGRIEWIRQLIREVQTKKAQPPAGKSPMPPLPQKPETIKPASPQPKPVPPAETKSDVISTLSPDDEASALRITTRPFDLPAYFGNVLSQLSLLTRPEDSEPS